MKKYPTSVPVRTSPWERFRALGSDISVFKAASSGESFGELIIADVEATPGGGYSFCVLRASGQIIVCYSFDTLDEACFAALRLKQMLPRAIAALQHWRER